MALRGEDEDVDGDYWSLEDVDGDYWSLEGHRIITSGEDGRMLAEVIQATDSEAKLMAAAPRLFDALNDVTEWLEGTEAFEQSHGAHSAAVEARKLLARMKE